MNFYLLFLIILLSSNNTFALGRFFMNAEKRTQLEQKTTTDTSTEIEPEIEKKLHINGFIKAKHGGNTIWINGKKRSTAIKGNYHVRHWVSPNHQVSIDLQGKKAQLSPGQTLDLDSQVVTETPYPVVVKDTPKKKDNSPSNETMMQHESNKTVDSSTETSKVKDMVSKLKQIKQLQK